MFHALEYIEYGGNLGPALFSDMPTLVQVILMALPAADETAASERRHLVDSLQPDAQQRFAEFIGAAWYQKLARELQRWAAEEEEELLRGATENVGGGQAEQEGGGGRALGSVTQGPYSWFQRLSVPQKAFVLAFTAETVTVHIGLGFRV
jgi:hypothetical protein